MLRGERGIRTLGGLSTPAVFKTAALNRSAISPNCAGTAQQSLRQSIYSNEKGQLIHFIMLVE